MGGSWWKYDITDTECRDYNNDLRVSLQAFYGGERIVVPEIFDKKPELKAEIDKELVADIDDNRINIEL